MRPFSEFNTTQQVSKPWSMHLGKALGVDVYIHATFVLLLAWFGIGEWIRSGSALIGLMTMFSIMCLFGIVVLHELGHAMAARYYGIPTRDITLYPMGGVASLERMPRDPKQELVIALAGPAVNIVLAILAFIVLVPIMGISIGMQFAVTGSLISFIVQFFWINAALAIFNLLPAFPMDGGRVLRALLALKLNYIRATEIAAKVGKCMAVVFAILGFYASPILILIAVFVWFGATQEFLHVRHSYRTLQDEPEDLTGLTQIQFGNNEIWRNKFGEYIVISKPAWKTDS